MHNISAASLCCILTSGKKHILKKVVDALIFHMRSVLKRN